ncbi:hypothetical protein FY557_14060 [Chryseobacterium sp. SN22]|uniref:beta strand repeat-containing protein n=1 Tax=Chryseobacterium sp. SN22 TaxID=2606431 RepID=UPI0011EEA076|nr:DUF11 domain-containing protein [Chryseobacterium sp. SN22]KAA0127109.1 hypothetical protein FY557_14060 [Chryseobacterium sp. SN22]
MKKFNVLLLLIALFYKPHSFYGQQSDRLYLSFAATGRVYDITGISGTVSLPTPLASPVPTTAAEASNLAVGYDNPGGNPNSIVFINSDITANAPIYKNGVQMNPPVTGPNAQIGGIGTNNVPGTYFGRVYGFQSNTKILYPIYPSGATLPITAAAGDTDWNAGTTFGTDTFFDYENNIYTFLNNSANTARYLYKIAIATGVATKAVQLTGPVATVAGIRGMAYLNGLVYTATLTGTQGGTANTIQINSINISTGVSTAVATINIGSNFGNLDLASVPYYVPFTFTCNGAAFQGNSTFSTGYPSTRTVRIPISNVYGPGTYTINVSGTDFATTSQNVTIAAGSTFIDIPVTYNGTGAAGQKTATIRLGNSSTVCSVTATAEASFGCNSSMYISQNTTVYNVNTTSNPFTFPAVGSYTGNINSIGINPVDGLMYGTVDNSNTIVRINASGTFTLMGAVSGLPTGVTFNAGEFDATGNYYVKQSGSNATLYRVNIATMSATALTLSQAINISDFAYRTADGRLYSVSSDTDGRLLSINLSTSPATVTFIGANSSLIPFGAMFASSTGEVYGSLNTGGFYQFNLTNGQRTLISSSPASNSNDGAHCVTAPIAFSADLYATVTDGATTYSPGSPVTYTVVVGNNGPFGVQGATVTVPLPTGIPAANITYTAVGAGGATSSVTGTQTGAVNDVVNLPLNGTVTYTITVNIPVAYTGNLTTTVNVTSPANSTDPNTANNTATDTNVQSVCYNPVTNTAAGIDTRVGITLQKNPNVGNGNWPFTRKSAHVAIESNSQGLVVTRMETAALSNITTPQEGMMVFDTTVKCLKIYSDGAWRCFSVPSCP